MESIFRKRFFILFGIILILSVGCASKSDVTKLQERMDRLESMLGTMVSASFYPARSIAGSGTGSIGAISGTVDKDMVLAALEEDATYGNTLMPFLLDEDGGSGDDSTNTPPNYVESADSGERWNLGGLVGYMVSGNNKYLAASSSPTAVSCMVMRGGFVHVGATLTLNLSSVANCANISGNNPSTPCFLVWNSGAYTVTINPDDGDRIIRDGTAQTDGVSITLASGAGNYVGMCIDSAAGLTTLGSKGTLAQGS